MNVRSRILPAALLVALVVALGCTKPNGNTNGTTEPVAGGPASIGDNPRPDVGPLLFTPTPANGEIPAAPTSANHSANTSLVIANCTVQFEDRQQITAEVDATIDMIAMQPKVLPKGTYLVELRADGSVVPFEPTLRYPGVVVEQNVPKRNGTPLPQQPQDSLIYDRRSDGSLVLLKGSFFPRNAFIVERRADGSFLPYTRTLVYPPKTNEEGITTTLVPDAAGIPYWETKDKDGKPLTKTMLDKWPGNSFIGEQRPDGSFVPAGLPAGFPNLQLHPRDGGEKVVYCKVSDGDTVEAGDVICYLDDQMVTARMEAATRTAAAAKLVQTSAKEGVAFTKKKLDISLKLYNQGTLSYSELLQDQVTLTRFEENHAQAAQTIAKAESDYKEAAVLMRKHMVTSRVNGAVRNVVKRPGEFVKSGEKIMDIQSTESVRLEGNLDRADADKVTRGMTVLVEPAIPSSPVKSHYWHKAQVTGVIVTPHPDRPLVVSASKDKTAQVWDPNLKDEKGRPSTAVELPHPVEVLSIACGPFNQANRTPSVLIATGSADGKLRIWDLGSGDLTKIPKAPKVTTEDAHALGVSALAFSADGKFIASAAGREVFVWDAETGKKRYALPAEHQDVITCLHFTPQSNLVTASRDRTLKVWKLGTDKGLPMKTIEHRTGAVDVLGVSKDGSRALFDKDKGRIDVVSLADKSAIGQISSPGSTAAFATLALFSPNEELIVTASGEGEMSGALQVWRAPQVGGRGSEIARLITPGRVGVTCGGFSPVVGHPFLVVGTAQGHVHIWTPPANSRLYEGVVKNVEATDRDYVTVRVVLDNRELKLLDRSAATIIIPGK